MISVPRSRRLPSALLSALLALGGVACGGSSTSDGDGDTPGSGGQSSGSGGESSGSGGSGSGGGTGGSSAAGGSSGSMGSGGSGADCSQYEDAPTWSLMVQITNQTGAPLHLGQRELSCGAPRLFDVFEQGVLLADFPMCRQPCEAVMRDGPLGCPAFCAYPSTITLKPGEATQVEWSGQYAVDVALPDQCLPQGGNSGISACDRAARIEPGIFTFAATAGTSLDCSQTSGTCEACAPNGRGGCMTQGALVGGEEISAEVTVELDASYGVGDVVGGGAIRNVEIVFEE